MFEKSDAPSCGAHRFFVKKTREMVKYKDLFRYGTDKNVIFSSFDCCFSQKKLKKRAKVLFFARKITIDFYYIFMLKYIR